MSDRPCHCGKLTDCHDCWLAEYSPPHRVKWGLQKVTDHAPVQPQAPPADPRDWPRPLKWVYRVRAPGDVGAGDTIHTRLGLSGRLFEKLMKRLGFDCKCPDRRAWFNLNYPYPKES